MTMVPANPFISEDPLDPELHQDIITRRDLPAALLDRINANDYCMLLGPRNSGRTTTLHLVARTLAQQGERVPVYVDPEVLDLTDEGGFLQSLRDRIRREFESRGHETRLPPATASRDAVADLTQFLTELTRAGLRPVILLDAIEDVPPNLLTHLLNIAHLLFTRRDLPENRHLRGLVFVFAGFISLRYLTTYEDPSVSPFNVCTDLVVHDLTNSEADQFLQEVNQRFGLHFRYAAMRAVIEHAGGDLNLIQQLGGLAVELAKGGEVLRETVEAAAELLLQQAEQGRDETLRNMALEIEADSSTFDLVVTMLREEDRAYDPQQFTDALFHELGFTYPEMTGALKLVRRDGTPVEWSFRNQITRRFLQAHFAPARIVRTYTALGKFDKAIERCGPLLEEIRREFDQPGGSPDHPHLNDVIIAMTNRIYAEGSHEIAFGLLSRLLTEAFGCANVVYYDYRPTLGTLHAVRFLSDLFENNGTVLDVNSARDRERPEVRAFRSRLFAVAQRPDSGLRVAIPVENMDGEVTAVVALTPRLRVDKGVYLTSRMHVVQRALRWINFALNRLERDNKLRIIETASHISGPDSKPRVFVAHRFTSELLENLRDQLGRVDPAFEFRYVDQHHPGGLLNSAIQQEMRDASLGLFEVSHVNANVYYELGYGLGINRPGVMFLRESLEREELIPPMLKGILHLPYRDYSGLVEGIARRLEELLRRYVNREREHYFHFPQCEIPADTRRRTRYAVVLDHDQFGDVADYRQAVAAGLAGKELEIAYALDDDLDVQQFLSGPLTGRRLVDLYLLLKHADLVVARCEEVTDSVDAVDAVQAFVGLGMAHGLGKQVVLTRREQDFHGTELGVPDDLAGLQTINYSRLSELQSQLKRTRLSTRRNGKPRSGVLRRRRDAPAKPAVPPPG